MAYLVSVDYKNMAKSKAIFWRSYFKIIPDNVDVTESTNLQRWVLKHFTYDNNDGSLIGNVVSKMVELQLVTTSDYELENKKIQLFSGLVLNPTAEKTDWITEYVPHGTFIIQPVNNGIIPAKTKFTAYDLMINFNIKYVIGSLTFPATALQVVQYLCQLCNVELDSTVFTNSDFIIDNGDAYVNYTCREVLSSVCKLTGTIAVIGRNDKLQLISFGQSVTEAIDKNNYFTFEKNKYWGGINELVLNSYDIEGENVTESDEEDIALNGLTQITLQDPLILYNQDLRALAITDLWTKLHGVGYTPFKMVTSCYNWLDPLDMITVADLDSQVYTSYVLNQTITFDLGKLRNEISSPALTTSEVQLKLQTEDIMAFKRTEILVNKHENTITLLNTSVGEAQASVVKMTSEIGRISTMVTDASTLLNNEYLTAEQVEALTNGNLGEINNLKIQYSSLLQTAGNLQIQITSINTNGISKLQNTLVLVDENGIDISKTGEEMSATFGYFVINSETRMGLQVNRDNEEVLGADNTGVRAENVTVRNYLVIGEHSRMENYQDGTGVFAL